MFDRAGRRALLIFALCCLPLYALQDSSSRDRLRGEIVDSETGERLAAAVSVIDRRGQFVDIEGQHSHVDYLSRRWCYVDGEFTLVSDDVELNLEVRRGPETIPLKQTIKSSPGVETFALRRWIHMKKNGFVSGDGHVHYLSLKDSHLQMRAEDLNVLNLQTSDFTGDLEKFTGQLDPVSTHAHSVYVGQELRDWQQGHTNFLRIKKIVQPLEPFGGSFGDRVERNLLLAPAMREAKAQDGSVAWAHFSNLPGTESPIDIALGLVDAIELVTYDDPTELPSHWSAWENSGMSQAEFTVMRGQDLYYQYLNAGFHLPITAGTDKMGENIPVGSNRLYARFESEPSYDQWLKGMKEGNGFVTNGPILTFNVDGKTMGDVTKFRDSCTVLARATARSVLPFSRLEIIKNGESVALGTKPTKDRDGIFRAQLESRIELRESSWLAARVAQRVAVRRRILPRGLTVYAHTNPVYFLEGGKRVLEAESVEYLQKYVRGTLHWLKTGARFASPEVKQEAIELAEEALLIYEDLK